MKFTIIQSKNNISKKFKIDFEKSEEGELVKEDGGNLHTGNFITADMNINELGDFLKKCTHKQIIVQGLTGYDKGLITTKKNLKQYDLAEHATVSRSKEYFKYIDGEEGFLLLDYDPNEFYKNGKVLNKEEFLELIYKAVPEIKNSPHLWKTSSGSNIVQIKDKDGNKCYKKLVGLKGQHLIIHVSNMSDINNFFNYLYHKLWIMGEGYVFVDKVGRLHDRTIVDKVVNSPEREIFLRACLDEKYLKQDLQIEIINSGKSALDLGIILEKEDLIEIEEKFDVLHRKELSKYNNESKKRLDSYVKKNAEKHSMSKESLRHSILERKLFSDFKIKLSDGTYVSVEKVLDDADKYSGKYCYEPFEPEYGGYCSTKAWIDANNNRIYSHAHGGIEYELVDYKKKSPDQLAHYLLGIDNEKKRYKEAVKLTNEYNYELTEIDSLLNKIHISTGQKLKSIQNTFAKYKRQSLDPDNIESDVQLNYEAASQVIGVTEYDYPLNAQFPHVDIKGRVASTAANLKFMLEKYGVQYSYNQITKKGNIEFPNSIEDRNNLTDEANFLNIQSMCVVNGMSKDTVGYLPSVLHGNVINPVYDWIKEAEWDGKDRVDEFIKRIKTDFKIFEDPWSNRDFTKKYMDKVIRMWLVECIAALDGSENTPIKNAVPSYEYVLVFVGKQGIGKTKFLSSLLPFEFRDHIVTGHELDTKNKDSIIKALSCWICELGELDSTFKKSEISSLKAFLSNETDIIRLPYGRTELRMKRSTVFCGSVNGADFLKDRTGNRRYLPVNVKSVVPLNKSFTYEEDVYLKIESKSRKSGNGANENGTNGKSGAFCNIQRKERYLRTDKTDYEKMNVQQLWAQVYQMYLNGYKWWPDEELERMLKIVTDGNSQIGFIDSIIEDYIDMEKNDDWREKHRIVGLNKKYVDSCRNKVEENRKNGKGYEYGSIDSAGKSVSLFFDMNVKELFDLIGLEYNRVNMREFNEIMKLSGFSYVNRKINGTQKKCYRVCLKPRDNVFSLNQGSGEEETEKLR